MPIRCRLTESIFPLILVCLSCLALSALVVATPSWAHEESAKEFEKEVVVRGECLSDDEAPLDLPAYRARLEAYYYSGEYESEIAEVIGEARSYLERRLSEGVEKPAIVFDIDETSLSNWAQMKELQFGYVRGIWHEWVETASAYGIGPTLELARWAHDHGVALFFITGRGENEREATAENLKKVGYAPWVTLYLEDETECCTGDSCDFAATCKSFYRKEIHDAGYTIVVNVGDQRSDLLGGWAERGYKLPNPFYFVP